MVSGVVLSVQADDEYKYIEAPVAKQVADLMDDDRDGVINARDKCKSTVLGAEIDNEGCGTNINTKEEFQLKILFSNDSTVISPAFISEIENMSEFLSRYPETSIELQGYASKVGSPDHNLELSRNRADQVKLSLIKAGIDNSRIEIVGFGDSVLISQGTDEQSHALNRRVIATVIGYTSEILEEWTIFSRKANSSI